jgi:hypothetical protein
MRSLLALAVLVTAVPALAQADDPALLRGARSLGNDVSGLAIGHGAIGDKALFLGRRGGEVLITGLVALVPGGELVEPTGNPIAVVRTRSSAPGGNGAPDPADFAYAARTGVPLFIVGEWRSPPLIWEVVGARYREIDGAGAPGPWRSPSG